ncbi:MAG: hypothetical protein PHC61_04535 [Chitinivibrionales bacterium]|nr:hypothetical protein [Chitinivibrionales bacterium]
MTQSRHVRPDHADGFFTLGGSLFLILLLTTAVYADKGGKKAIALETTPCYEEPRGDLLPQTYLGSNDTCTVDSLVVDSSGTPWFRVIHKNRALWALGSKLRYISAITEQTLAARTEQDQDKFRRLKVLRQHDEWPRRIKNAVRAGQICLAMSGDQLTAAWNEPLEKEKLFILGIGDCKCWHYNTTDKKACSVIVQNDAVIGWSMRE